MQILASVPIRTHPIEEVLSAGSGFEIGVQMAFFLEFMNAMSK